MSVYKYFTQKNCKLETMKNPTYWKKHYVVHGNADEIERNIKSASFTSGRQNFELVYFETSKNAPNILISEGSGGHAYVFAELGYLIYLRGYNVFIMPKHGGYTIQELVQRHRDALSHIAESYDNRIGVFAEGLGGFAVFYLTLAGNAPIASAVYQNSPALITDPEWQKTAIQGKHFLVLLGKLLAKFFPQFPFPISAYLNWTGLIDPKEGNRVTEDKLVREGYLCDPDFDKWYPLKAILSLMTTHPPKSLAELKTPTMFMVALRGFGGSAYVKYLKDLYARLPVINKKVMEIDGSVYWMLSHPKEAAEVITGRFNETL